MANQTIIGAQSIHGTDPQNLIPLITRTKIYNSYYWKEQCFALTAESFVDKAVTLKYVGGLYTGLAKPTQFLCLVCKLLQIQPDADVISYFLTQKKFKYLTALAAYYIRLTARAMDTYLQLEPLYADYRKISMRTLAGWSLVCMDEFIDLLLTQELVCDVTMPYLPPREKLENPKTKGGYLPRRVSALDAEVARARLQHPSTQKQPQNDDNPKKRARHDNGNDNDGEGDEEGGGAEKPTAAEGTTEYWNQMRANMGLKPLKQ
jgi:pre-mRNA-splicing factor 38A